MGALRQTIPYFQNYPILKDITISDIILYIILIIAGIWVLYTTKVIGVKKGAKKSVKERDDEKFQQSMRNFVVWLLDFFNKMYMRFGALTKEKEFELNYIVERVGINIGILQRPIKVQELVGIFRTLQLISAVIAIIVFAQTFNVVAALCCLIGLLIPKIFELVLKGVIDGEDEELEKTFPDLYLLLYSRLVQGANGRIEPTIKDYINSLDAMYGKGVSHNAIRKWCARFSINTEIYGDESMALKQIRDYYRSPTMLNFCNLAIQALSGVDNADKLLTFKQELSEQRKVMMDKAAEKLVAKGTRAIYIIYFILFEFIILSWVSKIDLSMLSSFMG